MYPASKHINLDFLTSVLIVCFVLYTQLICAQMAPETKHQTACCDQVSPTAVAQYRIKDRFLCQCFEKNDSLCFSLVDLITNKCAFPTQAIHALKYVNQNHQQAQSLQLKMDTGEVFKNRLYIAWADQKNGENNWDVFLVYSDDLGLHWTDPILVTYRPNHKNQWSPKLNVDSKSGQVSLLYFDQQNDVHLNFCDVSLAQSINGGLKFDYFKLNDKPLLLKKNSFCDFFEEMNQQTWASWCNPIEKKRTQINLNELAQIQEADYKAYQLIQIQSSIAYKAQMAIDFFCAEDLILEAEISKPIDPRFNSKHIKAKAYKKGNNQLLIDMKSIKLPKGNYTLTLYYKGINKYIWITEE